MTRKAIAVFILSLSFPLSAFAAEANRQPAADAKEVGVQLADGGVRTVDKETGKVTIKHGPLVSLHMPAMTMVFRVEDPAMLDQLKAGDKINFEAAKVNGAYTVIKLETIKR